jgi:hypothetical protein
MGLLFAVACAAAQRMSPLSTDRSDYLKPVEAAHKPLSPSCNTIDLTGAYTRAAGDNAPEESLQMLFDGNMTTKWLDFGGSRGHSWFELRFANPVNLTQYSMTSANDGAQRDPSSWTLYGYERHGRPRVTLDVQEDFYFHARHYTHTFQILNPAPYKVFRFMIRNVASKEFAGKLWPLHEEPDAVSLADLAFYSGACNHTTNNSHVVLQRTYGDSHTVQLMGDGSVFSWGNGINGKLGHGDVFDREAPTKVTFLTAVAQISAGGSHTLFLMQDTTIESVGSGAVGQLGHRHMNHDISTPQKILVWRGIYNHELKGAVQVEAGQHHSVALFEDGTVAVWGCNLYNQLGDAAPNAWQDEATAGKHSTASGKPHYITTPTFLPNITAVKQVDAGSTYTLLYSGDDRSEIKTLGQFTRTTPIENQYPQMTPDTSYGTQIVQATRTWSARNRPGWVGSVAQANKPDIDVWRSYDTLREQYGGHNWRYDEYGNRVQERHLGFNGDVVGALSSEKGYDGAPPSGTDETFRVMDYLHKVVGAPRHYMDGAYDLRRYIDKDQTTKGGNLAQYFESTSWRNADTYWDKMHVDTTAY